MTSAKEEILGRVRSALRDVPADETPADSPVEWVYHRSVEVGNIIDTFEQRVVDYKAAVVRSPKAKLAAALTTAARDLGVTSAVVPAGLAQAWRDGLAAAGVEVVEDNPGHRLSHSELNDTGAVVTAAACGVALTGTIVLDHSADQGRRALSLVPDVHICVVMADQVVSGVPGAGEARCAGRAAAHLDQRRFRDQRHRVEPCRGRARSTQSVRDHRGVTPE